MLEGEGNTALTGGGGEAAANEGEAAAVASRDATVLTGGEGGEKDKPEGEKDKPEGEQQKPEGEKDKDDGEAKGAPEQYEDFTLPEGFEVAEGISDEFKTVAKELNLSQADAQKLVDLQTKFVQEQAEAGVKQWDEMRASWLKEAKADKEIGGQKFNEHVETAKRALDEFGTPELKTMLERFGIGNHPEVIRTFSRIGAKLGEDQIVTGGQSSGGEKTLAERIFSGPTTTGA